MSNLGTRPCGCPPDAPNHADTEPDMIGNVPIMHGESERPIPGSSHTPHGLPDAYCLCGHPPYQHCPGWLHVDNSGAWGDDVMDLEIGR